MNAASIGLVKFAAVLAAAALLSACGGISCERPERYAGAGSAAPLKVPEDLSSPDTSRALRIPPKPLEEPAPTSRRGPCLESPPDFFDRPVLGEADRRR